MERFALAERILPSYQYVETHSRVLPAASDSVLDAVQRIAPADDRWARRFMALRELPGRLSGALPENRPPFGMHSFTPLARDGESEMVLGLAGAFWRADFGLREIGGLEDFIALNEPGVARLLLSFHCEIVAEGVRLSTQTRVHCPDVATRLRFAPYWYLIRPVSGLIRRRMLRQVERELRRGAAMA
ncbi:hypothetical protein CH06BL_16960 [Chromobacterium haemolyticum]|uniref:DUF2867 domain-containing protein n=1 Tax=Chromobacterium haemolyticum TaxID=394935 RepID=UPI0005B90906|nr:DUF2867 domain-containing protein [Chromobacterium haemolyticum]MBO0501314.1 DUF2867 domain-containing protein [Chromobacterium haemolyticum]BBH12448.1 hypothetical protein CH06BL_16960 [Chromobacterium haemolyticum]